MRDRPIYVGLICWSLILYNTCYLVRAFWHVSTPDMAEQMDAVHLPARVQVAEYFMSYSVPLVCAIFMSEGVNWARVLYIGWGLFYYLVAALVTTDEMDVLPGLAVFSVISLVLLAPRTREWFLLPQHFS